MSDIKNKFRSSYGLDAGGEKLINVALADKNVLTDGLNVAYMIQENTIQVFDPTRTYPINFAVLFNNRMWISKLPITAKPFVEGEWMALRTDPKWIPFNSGIKQLNSGDYITVDTSVSTGVEFTLPSNAQDGDIVSIVDVGGNTGLSDVVIKAGLQSIMDRGQRLIQTKMTVPYSEYVFIYMNRLWNLFNKSEEPVTRFIKPSGINYLQSGQNIVRVYDKNEKIIANFPKNANNGDMIQFLGMSKNASPYFEMELNTYDATTSIIDVGTKKYQIKRVFSGYFVFNETAMLWEFFDSDLSNRLRTVSADTQIFPNETISVVGQNNTTTSTINLSLPNGIRDGDQVSIALNYIRKGQTVNILATGGNKILSNENLLQFPKRSTYPPSGNWVSVDKLTFNGNTSYPPVMTFAYIDMGPIQQWMVVHNSPQVERVDPLDAETRARLGVIALATQTQANLDKSAITDEAKEIAITPETLANRTALETRQGISAIATSAQVNQDSTASFDDLTFVTPKKLNERTATETRRGLAEIATQAETNAATDDVTIVTPKKLDAKRATETMAGSAMLVVKNATEGANRASAGTGIYNFIDGVRIVTPLTLNEYKSTEKSQGGVFLATLSEVIGGSVAPAGTPIVVTPEMLHQKTANETRIGFTQVATQAEVNAGTDDFKYVTPKKIAARQATEGMTGIARIATQTEFNSGNLDNVISTPLKVKTFFDTNNRLGVDTTSGLTTSGTIWTKINLNVVSATETQRGTLAIATQVQTNAGADDTTIITPKKLQNKKASQVDYGVIRTASFAETEAGTNVDIAVTPGSLYYAVTFSPSWEASPIRRGFVKMADGALVWSGTDVAGNTKPLSEYFKTGYAISPYELNNTLQHYLPIGAKAVDSNLLDGLDNTQFVRRDIDQTVDGIISFTKSISTVGLASFGTQVDIGTPNDGTYDVSKMRLRLRCPKWSAYWEHSMNDTTTGGSISTYSIGYNGAKSITFTSSGNAMTMHGNVTLATNLIVGGTGQINGTLNSSVALMVGGKDVARNSGNNINFGNSDGIATIKCQSAATSFLVSDPDGTYKILNEKNMNTILDPIYANVSGDTFTGRVNVNAPSTNTIAQTVAAVALIGSGNANNFGTWVSEITTNTLYQQLPGYVVPVAEMNQETGLPTGFIDHYDEFAGPGTLSQFGSSAVNGSGTYQIWAPRPLATTDGHIAGTFYMRSWNTIKNDFDGWGRLYTSNNPPTASDIGAMANNGSVFDSLRIRDWIQVGNIRISADKVNKSVKFDWIDDQE